jgi:hypothetical protein
MVSKESFVNKIRKLNYTFKSQQKRTDLWRKKGGTHCIFVPLKDKLEDEFVISALRQAGENDKEIQAFLSSARS